LVPYILVTGQRLTGGHLLLRLSDIAAQNYEGEELERFLQGIDRVITELGARDDDGFTVRGIGPGTDVSISEFPGASTGGDRS
jgi:hypothetical protein